MSIIVQSELSEAETGMASSPIPTIVFEMLVNW